MLYDSKIQETKTSFSGGYVLLQSSRGSNTSPFVWLHSHLNIFRGEVDMNSWEWWREIISELALIWSACIYTCVVGMHMTV